MANDDEPSTDKVQSHMNNLLNIENRHNNYGFPLNLSDVQRLQNLELNYAGFFFGSHSKKTSSSPFFGVEVSTIMSP